ncbi:MAG: MogA/MoaB family molybdenum cofactor biosynthesis protein [Actinomycetota bacterium]|nr:MogA/MoaB family molybdenum cofactor biosynthesis protein [Actinomycetota bacterium]
MARVLIVTISDRVAAGTARDLSGELAAELMAGAGFEVAAPRVVPDELELIAHLLVEAAEGGVDLVLTTGGTGLAPRDVTPEATKAVVERDALGLVELMRTAGIAKTPLAALSRAHAGVRGNTLIVNLPGSPKAVEESLEALLPVLPHALRILSGDGDHGAP